MIPLRGQTTRMTQDGTSNVNAGALHHEPSCQLH